MKLVVGLGNPGRKYEGTRHNVGFAVVREVARRHATSSPKSNFQAELVEADLRGQRTLLLLPQTFMNLSGTAVGGAFDFYKLEVTEVLVVCDDFNLPLGKLRFRGSGSSGGQKGLADILRRLGTEDVPRLRLGVGPVPPNWEAVDFVLSRFTKQEQPEIELQVQRAADGVVDWAAEGLPVCMNRYN
jgi:peptidyl-tRNA hydrolase, PTH1 family